MDTQNVHGGVALYEGVGMSVYRRDDIFDIGTSEAPELTRDSGKSWIRALLHPAPYHQRVSVCDGSDTKGASEAPRPDTSASC